MTSDSHRRSRSVEDYLKAVFGLTRDGSVAGTSDLAGALAVQPSSVTNMVKRLAAQGLLEYIPYRGVRLTEEGTRIALRVIRRHRILETYLTERLGYAWEEVHDEAERLEHTASERLIDAMARALGDPDRDPHGAPIPTVEGHMESPALETLADAPLGTLHVIQSVRDERASELQAMESFGLVPGARVEVTARSPGEPVSVRVHGRRPSLAPVPRRLAERIFVMVAP